VLNPHSENFVTGRGIARKKLSATGVPHKVSHKSNERQTNNSLSFFGLLNILKQRLLYTMQCRSKITKKLIMTEADDQPPRHFNGNFTENRT